MQRSSALLLVAGATGVLVSLGALVRAVHSNSPRTEVTAHRDAAASSAPIASRDPGTTRSAGGMAWRAQAERVKALRERADDTSSAPPPPPTLAEHPRPGSPENTQHLEYGGTQLRAQTAAVEPLIVKCLDDAAARGQAPTGKASLTYIVAKKGDKYVIEDTGIDDDKTTIQAGPLLDCLRDTARGMKFVGLPKEADGIYVTRAVTVDKGKLVSNKHVTFTYLR